MVASAITVKIGHEINPDFQIGCMLAMVPFYARTCRPQDEIAAQIAMEHRLYYYGDLHVFGEYPSFMKAFQKEKRDCSGYHKGRSAISERRMR